MLEILQHLFDLASGKHLNSDKTFQKTCQEIMIQSSEDVYLQLDGEPIPPSNNVKITISPEALKVMVPCDLPRPLFMKNPL